MLDTVASLCNAAGLRSPAPSWKEEGRGVAEEANGAGGHGDDAGLAGTASALPGGEHGQGAAHTTLIPQAQFGIAMAISHNFGGGCGIGCGG